MKQHGCLNSEALANYSEGRCRGQAIEQIEAHLSLCSRCMETILVLQQVCHLQGNSCMQAVPHALTQGTIAKIDRIQNGSWLDLLLARSKAWIMESSRLLNRFRFPYAGSLVPVRGRKLQLSDDIMMFSRSFTDLDTEIEIEKLDSRLANVKVSICGSIAENSQVRISLVRSKREVASYLVSKEAIFFESIPFGRYTLSYTHNGANIGKFDFKIKAADDGGPNA